MDFTTLLTDIWIYVESYVPLMSPNEDETGLALITIALVMDFTTLLTDIWIYVESYVNQIVLHIIKPELHGNNCYWEVKAIHNIALVMDFTTLLTDIWIYVESYVPLQMFMSPNEDETGLALLITSRESNSSSYNQARITRK